MKCYNDITVYTVEQSMLNQVVIASTAEKNKNNNK
jgi:hypothetical protein